LRERQKSGEKREEEKKREKEQRKRKKISDQLIQDDLLLSQEKVKELKKAMERGERKAAEVLVDCENLKETAETIDSQSAEESEVSEEEEEGIWKRFEEVVAIFLSDPKSLKEMTSLDQSELELLHIGCQANMEKLTWRGTIRKNLTSSSSLPMLSFIFLTLFWLRHYPTLAILSAIFKIHPRTATRILKRTIIALKMSMENKIVMPSENEMSSLMYSFGHNPRFMTSVCVVDGTEIQISCPKDRLLSRKTWSVKKHQNSLNLMLITKLNGEIIYFSPLQVGAHDQSQWKELNL
jgi:hypothetical protein